MCRSRESILDSHNLLEQIDHLDLNAAVVETQLAFWANALRTHGQDLLAGDLSVLDQPKPIVRCRKKRRKKKLWPGDP